MHTYFKKLNTLAIKNAFLVLHPLKEVITPIYKSLLKASQDDCIAQNWLNRDLSLTSSGKALLETSSPEQIEQEIKELAQLHPELKSYAMLLATCARHTAAIVQGHISAQEILFEDAGLLPSIYGNNPIADTLHEAMKTLFRELVPNQQLDILEVGAGTGATTRSLIAELRQHKNWSYTFSDISPHFVHMARSSDFFDPAHFSCITVNLNNPADLQQKLKKYDLIIGTNVLHACADVQVVLKNLRSFLKPAGRCIFGEITRVEAYLTYTFGLLKEWWQGGSESIRLNNSPLLSVERWQSCCKEAGLENFRSITPAQTPWQTAFCTSLGVANSTVDELKKIIADLLVKPISEIDEQKTFAELGVDSLLVLTFIGKVHQYFNNKLRAADIFDYPTIAKLAAHLEQKIPPKQTRTTIEKTYRPSELLPYMQEHKKNNRALMPIDGWLRLILEAHPKEQQAICKLHLLSPYFETETPLFLTLTPQHEGYLGTFYSIHNSVKTTYVEFESNPLEKTEQAIVEVEEYPNVVSAQDLFTTPNMHIGQSYRVVESAAYSSNGFLCNFSQTQSIPLHAYLHGIVTCALKFAKTADFYLPSFVKKITFSQGKIDHAIGILKSKDSSSYTFDLHLCNEENKTVCTLEDFTIKTTKEKSEPPLAPAQQQDEIAVVGMSGLFGKAANLQEFWKVLENGECIVCEAPEKRKDAFNNLKAGYIHEIDTFDHEFFHISRQEAEHMDPQQRLLLEQSYRAFEDAGYTKAHIQKMKDSCGVFVGASDGDYLHHLFSTKKELAPQAFWGNAPSVLSGRLSYYFDFHGPSITVDTACSSSLVALHLACQSIRSGECKSALVGGLFLLATDLFHSLAAKAEMLSNDGLCHTFDQKANGFVPGEAVVAIVLKPLKDAIKNKDKIYGVIKATGVNHDGRTNTLTSPSANAQESLLSNTYKRHKISPRDIAYVETHGTGTILGDPIEIEGLTRAFLSLSEPAKCPIGSVKTTLGHTAAAAGLVGLVKILLSLNNQKLPASLHFHHANSEIDFDRYGFWVVDRLTHWPKTNKPRLAAVSSFGFSGTNAHAVLGENPHSALSIKSSPTGASWPIFLSGHTAEILLQKATDLLAFLTAHADTYSLESISYTLACRRDHFHYRLAFTAATIKELCDHLAGFINNKGELPAATPWSQLISEYLSAKEPFEVFDGLFLEKALVPLPRHPFQKISHWVTTNTPKPNSFSAPQWLFEEHALMGSSLLPGMALVAIIHALQPCHLHNFVWKKTIKHDEQPLTFVPTGTDRFVVKNAYHQEVAAGACRAISEDVESPNFADLIRQFHNTRETATFYEQCKKAGFTYGPRFQGIKNIKVIDPNSVLASYEVSSEFHTLLFDICLQPILALYFDSPVISMPHSFDSFTVVQTPTYSGYTYIEKGNNSFNGHFYSVDGTLWGKIAGLRLEASPFQKNKSNDTLSQLKTIFGSVLQEDPDRLRLDVPFLTLGIDSSIMLTLLQAIETAFGIESLPKTLLYEYSTLESLAKYFTSSDSLPAAQNLETKDEPIAIIGVHGQFGPCTDLESYWNTLKQGIDCITPASPKRLKLWGITADQAQGYVGSWIEDIDLFEPRMYRIMPKEAESMDPQERKFLDCVQGLLETASYKPQTLGSKVGVFVGAMYGHYELYGQQTLSENSRIPNSSFATIANRVSSVMNWQGPSMAVDTMCSSSLTAIHLACMSLRQKECEVAVAGGINLHSHSQKYDWLKSSHFLSEDGRCRSFGKKPKDEPDGYVPGEGVGAVLLKPLSEAEKDGDYIWGVILGSAVNHGGTANGYTVPTPKAQQNVIQDALHSSGVDQASISYIEAHGTGTSLGDPIEIRALEAAFDGAQHTIAIGSVKSNIGHLEAAAGIAGLTKVLLQMQHKALVPSLHSSSLNPFINFSNLKFSVQQDYRMWTPQGDAPRTAGISAFGAGGSNAHLIVQEYRAADHHVYKKPVPRSRESYWVEYKQKMNVENISTIDGICFKINKLPSSKEDLLPLIIQAASLYNPACPSIDSRDHVISDDPLTSDGTYKIYFQKLGDNLSIYEVAQETEHSSIIHAQGHLLFSATRIVKKSWKKCSYSQPTSTLKPDLLLTLNSQVQDSQAVNPYTTHFNDAQELLQFEKLDILDVSDAIGSDDLLMDWDRWYHKIDFLRQLLIFAEGRTLRIVHRYTPNSLRGNLFKTLYKTLSAEYKNVHLISIESSEEVVIDFSAFGKQVSLAWREGSLYQEEQEVVSTSNRTNQLSEGTYIFVGGFGQIGQQVIDYACKRGLKRMVIVGSKKFDDLPDSRIAMMAEWKEQGITLQYACVDLSSQESVNTFIANLDSPIAGLFFLAGKQSSGAFSFIKKTYNDWKEVIDPKILGLYHFYQALKNSESLDFILAFSSISAAVPELGVGLSDYSFANSYMDTLSEMDQLYGTKKLFSVQWPAWENTRLGNQSRSSLQIKTEQAFAVIDAVLTDRPRDTWCILPGGDVRKKNDNRQELQAPKEPLLKKLETLFRYELKLKETHTLSYDTHFNDIGVDSILLADILKKLESEFLIPIPPTVLLDNPTLRMLAQHLELFN